VDSAWMDPDPLAESLHWVDARRMFHQVYKRAFRDASLAGGAQASGSAVKSTAGSAGAAPQPPAIDAEMAFLEFLFSTICDVCTEQSHGARVGADGASCAELERSVRRGWRSASPPLALEAALDRLVDISWIYVSSDNAAQPQWRRYRPITS